MFPEKARKNRRLGLPSREFLFRHLNKNEERIRQRDTYMYIQTGQGTRKIVEIESRQFKRKKGGGGGGLKKPH